MPLFFLCLVNIFTKFAFVYFYYAIILSGDDMEYTEYTDDKKYIERIRELREDHDYTQQFVADFLCTSQTMYARYERDANSMPIRHLFYLAKLYNVSSDYILGLTDIPRPLYSDCDQAAAALSQGESGARFNIHWKSSN